MEIVKHLTNLVNCVECNKDVGGGKTSIDGLCFDCWYVMIEDSRQEKETIYYLINELHKHQKEASLLKSSMDAHEEAIQAILNKLDRIVKDYR